MFETISSFHLSIKEELNGLSETLSEIKFQDQSFLTDTWQVEHKDQLLGLSSNLATFTREKKEKDFTDLLLLSLDFPQIRERHAKVAKAHADTFEWIFKNTPSDTPLDYTSFTNWLQANDDHSGIYWLTGKAGSGKSTLMKYLYEHERTQKHLQEWSGPQPIALASCFFWNAGTPMQKSLNGLLRSMLHDMLSQHRNLALAASPKRWRRYDLVLHHTAHWTDMELLDALRSVVKASEHNIKFCLFIDGLCEIDGDATALSKVIELLDTISTYPHVKICLSSRPWNIFLDAFNGRPCLQLHDLTRSDIRCYVQSELEANDRFIEYSGQNNKACARLASDVVDKALGVFLWVSLVVRSLLEGLQNGDNVKDLERRLTSIPADLEEFLQHIINSLDPMYLEQATQLFQVALKAHKPLSLLTYSFLHEDSEYALKAKVGAWPQAEVDHRLTTIKRRINSRCKGLLEVYKPVDLYGKADHRHETVDFLHRTVRDFLLTESMQALMAKSQVEGFDLNIVLCRAYLAQVKGINSASAASGLLENFLENFFEYARWHEITTSDTLYTMIDGLDRAIKDVWRRKYPYHSSTYHWTCDPELRREFENFPLQCQYENGTFLLLALGACLPRYVDQKLQKNTEFDEVPEIHYLLLIALGVEIASMPLVNHNLYSPLPGPDIALIKCLLNRGADPQFLCFSYPMWRWYIATLQKTSVGPRPAAETNDSSTWLEATHLLINHGAFAMVDCKSHVNLTKLGLSPSAQPQSILDIFKQAFGDKELPRLEYALGNNQQSLTRRMSHRLSQRFHRLNQEIRFRILNA